MRILCVGPMWRGSNAGGLFRALSRQECLIDVVDEYYYISFHASHTLTKVVQKGMRYFQVNEFNRAIKKSVELFKPDVVLVYKGRFVQPQTLAFIKSKGHRLALFYPDVSMKAHGKFIPLNMPYFDVVFTTKTFGIRDLYDHYGIKNAHFVPHGFDPEIHKAFNIGGAEMKKIACDVSFIGTYSPKKEKLLAAIKQQLPDVDLKIWGAQWYKSSMPVLQSSIQHAEVLGDVYSIAIQSSTINLGILNEQVAGASSGDLITSRTFHIPGCAGFLLHEKNAESLLYFNEGEQAGFFTDHTDIAGQVKFYLANNELRDKIRLAGYERAKQDHSLDNRARTLLQYLQN